MTRNLRDVCCTALAATLGCAVAGTSIVSASAGTSPELVPGSMPKPRSTITRNISADAPVVIEIGSRTFRIPAGYLMPWPVPEDVSRINRRTSFGFAFWMPEKRWVERNPLFLPDFRPSEEGRPPPALGSFVAFVRGVDVVDRSNLSGYVTPEQRYRNQMRGAAPGLYRERQRDDLGLIEIEGPAGQHRITYRHLPDAATQLLLDCSYARPGIVNPSCFGRVYFPDDEIGISIQFPHEALPQWKTVVQIARDFIISWRNE